MVGRPDEAGSRWRGAGGLALLALFATLATPARAGPLQSPGCLDGGMPGVVARVEPPFDLRLADGRLVRIAGLDPDLADPGSAIEADVRERLSRWLGGQTVRVLPLDAAPDRWGRTRAAVFTADAASGDGPAVSVAEALLDAGLARARPREGIAPCWTVYTRLEADARDAHRGLWADPERGLVAATDTAALRARIGSYVVVEGTIASLHDVRGRTYLRFAGISPGGLTASLDRRTSQRLARSGASPTAWLDHRVRLRGVVDDRWGLAIEITAPEQVEVVGP